MSHGTPPAPVDTPEITVILPVFNRRAEPRLAVAGADRDPRHADIVCRLAARDSLTAMRRTGVAYAKGFSYLSTDPRACVNLQRAATATTDGRP